MGGRKFQGLSNWGVVTAICSSYLTIDTFALKKAYLSIGSEAMFAFSGKVLA